MLKSQNLYKSIHHNDNHKTATVQCKDSCTYRLSQKTISTYFWVVYRFPEDIGPRTLWFRVTRPRLLRPPESPGIWAHVCLECFFPYNMLLAVSSSAKFPDIHSTFPKSAILSKCCTNVLTRSSAHISCFPGVPGRGVCTGLSVWCLAELTIAPGNSVCATLGFLIQIYSCLATPGCCEPWSAWMCKMG